MIKVENLSQSYGKKKVLDSISIHIEQNEICALVGRNGAGKSTFIHSILGLLPVKEGLVTINKIQQGTKNSAWKKEISYLPEKFLLYPTLTGWENMLFFAEASGEKPIHERIMLMLEQVGLIEDKDTQIKNYSKGMLQRLGLAVTLYHNTNILILDEPTSGIDPMGRKELLDVLKSLKDKTILLSSHHLDEIKQICSHVLFLDEGHMQKYTVQQFLETQRLGETAL